MEDTVTRAKREREKQGPWEVEVSYGEEADLHQHLKVCGKNPGHHKFVPVDQFTVDHLPPGCHDNDIVDLVRAVSDITVRVSVKYVSDTRPQSDPLYGKLYPTYKDRNGDIMRVGTGWVWRASVCKEVDTLNFSVTCPCHECQNSSTPKAEFGQIIIRTAAHLVYDKQEAANTTCHFFFDNGDLPDACSSVVTLTDGKLMWCDDVRDLCQIEYFTHDLELTERLDKMERYLFLDHGKSLFFKYDDLYNERDKSTSSVEDLPDDMYKLTIIVSHPHGCSKQVSVGYWTDFGMFHETESGTEGVRTGVPLKYTTATCPGSSGARVFVIKDWRWFHYYSVLHCGNCEEDKNQNFSNLV